MAPLVKPPFKPAVRPATLALTLLLLASCSSFQFAYNHLDHWIRWQLGDYVNLNDAQKTELRAALDAFHAWHRQTQLPVYADYFEQLAKRVEQGRLQQPDLASVEIQMRELLQTAAAQLYDLLLPLSENLSPAQIDQLEQRLRQKRDKFLEKWQKSPEKIQKRRKKQIRRHGKHWLGSLSKQQEQLISDWVAQIEYNPLLRHRQREIWQTRFIELLRTKPKGYQEEMRNLFLNPEQLWPEDYRQMREQRRELARQLSEQILASTTEAQRTHLLYTLRKYAKDFRALAQK